MSDARKEYADIIDREHHVSKKRQPMARLNRAAQFSPFAALTGYDDLIKESERETDEALDLDEDSKAALNEKLVWLFRQDNPPERGYINDKEYTKAKKYYRKLTGADIVIAD